MWPDFNNPLTILEMTAAWRLLVAAVFGAALGFERSLLGKHAGMRTYALVALGSCLFIVGGELILPWHFGAALDPTRIAAAVVVGIGFIGSGLALVHRHNGGGEFTTAAGVWVAAGIGISVGFGLYVLAFAATAISIGVFTLFLRMENRAREKYGVKSGSY